MEKIHISVEENAAVTFKDLSKLEGKSQSMMFQDMLSFYIKYRKDYLGSLESQLFKMKEGLSMSKDVKLSISTGKGKLKVLEKGGKKYVLGTPNEEYTIDIISSNSNNLVVATVDGLDVITGKPGDYTKSGGYVFGYHLEIEGWRTSNDNVSKFVFSSIDNSYASNSEHGDKENIGQIAIAVFHEKGWEEKRYTTLACSFTPSSTRSAQSKGFSAGGTSLRSTDCSETLSAFESKGLGTGWGETKESRVRDVEFDREDKPYHVEIINYRTADQLIQLGFSRKEIFGDDDELQKAFPGMKEKNFCKPPIN